MFCTTLRKRKEWATVPSTLLSQQQRKWQEQNLETHDLAIPLPQRQQNRKDMFRLLLLSAADIQPPEGSLARIERLYQAGGKHVGIVFLLHEQDSDEGNVAFMNIQATLLSSGLEMPILPLTSVSSLAQIISTFHRQLFQSHGHPQLADSATVLLPYCSNNPPIPEHARNILSDLYHSLPELSQAATTADGRETLQRYLAEPSPANADDVIGFWEQEYIAE